MLLLKITQSGGATDYHAMSSGGGDGTRFSTVVDNSVTPARNRINSYTLGNDASAVTVTPHNGANTRVQVGMLTDGGFFIQYLTN